MPVQLKMNVIKNYKVLEKPAYLKKNKERKVGQKKKIGVLASMRKLLKMCLYPNASPNASPNPSPNTSPNASPIASPNTSLNASPNASPNPSTSPNAKPIEE